MSLGIVSTDKHGVLRDGALPRPALLDLPTRPDRMGVGPNKVSNDITSTFARTLGRLPRRGHYPVPLHGLGQGTDE